MTLEEWHQVLATEPASPAQVGAVLSEFRRLGYRPGDRARRLAVSAALLGRTRLDSTRDLVMGDAGRLLRLLRAIRDPADLPGRHAAAVLPPAGEAPGIVAALAHIMTALAVALGCPIPRGHSLPSGKAREPA